MLLGAGVMAVAGAVFFLFPAQLGRVFSNQPEVIDMVVLLLPIAGAFQIVDGIQVVGAGVLRGTADTRFPAVIALIGYWVVGLPVGLFLAFPRELGPRGLWWGLTLGLASVAVLFIVRIRVRFAGEIAAVSPE